MCRVDSASRKLIINSDDGTAINQIRPSRATW